MSRGWAVEVNNTKAGAGVSIRDNIFAHDTRGTNAAVRLDTGESVSNLSDAVGLNDLTIEDNIAYRWHQGFYTDDNFVNGGSGLTGYNNVTVRNNDFQQMVATRMGRHQHAFDPAEGKWSGNRYADSDLSASVWFEMQHTNMSLDAWRTNVEPTAVIATAGYADPGRTISTYNGSLGGEASLAGYLREVRKQSQDNFRSAYTSAAAINYFRHGFAEGGIVPGGEVTVPAGTDGTSAPAADTLAPVVASYSAGGITTAGGTAQTFTITYQDETAISAASVGNGDVLVTGPNAYSQLATLVGSEPSADGTSVVAQYRIPAAGDSWDAADNGSYTVSLRANEVTDVAGNAAAAGTVGTFAVNIATEPAPIETAPAAPTDLKATATSRKWVRLSFIDRSDDETGFTLQRSLDGATWTTIATLGPAGGTGSSVTHQDGGLARRTAYHYRVSAFNSAGASAYTPVVTARTS